MNQTSRLAPVAGVPGAKCCKATFLIFIAHPLKTHFKQFQTLTSVAHESIISMLDFATSTAFVYNTFCHGTNTSAVMGLLINSHQLDHIFFNSIACQKYPCLSLVQHTKDVSLGLGLIWQPLRFHSAHICTLEIGCCELCKCISPYLSHIPSAFLCLLMCE